MSSGGGGNVFENIYNEIGKKQEDILGKDLAVNNMFARETRGVYNELDGTNARKKKAAEKEAKKAQTKQIAMAKKKQEDEKALGEARSDAEGMRDSAIGRTGSKKRKTGRSGTILTDSLGDNGGSENQGKKNLLGL